MPRPRGSSVRQCRHPDCSSNVPPRCPVGFCRAHCTSPRCQDHADGRRPRECRARGCHAVVPRSCSSGFLCLTLHECAVFIAPWEGPLFVLMSVALLLPVLLVCSELVLNIAIITSVCAVRPGVSHPRDHQGSAYAGCNRAVNQFMQNAAVGIAHCTVPMFIGQFHATPNGSGAGLRRATDP